MPVLNIKDAEAHALAVELARRSRTSLTAVVKQALREKLERERGKRRGLADRLMELADQGARLPVLDPRSPDEIIGYDENGVPN
jgi:antitoxin VapB